MVALTVGVPAGMGKDAVFAFGTSAKIEAFADFFAAGSVCCSVNSGGVRLDWWIQTCCDWHSVTKGASPTRWIISRTGVWNQTAAGGVGMSQSPHINVFLGVSQCIVQSRAATCSKLQAKS